MKLTKKQRENVAKILINLGSITFGGLGIGYFTSVTVNITEFVTGIIFGFICFYIAVKIDKE